MRQTHFSWFSFLNWTPVIFNNVLVNFQGPRQWNFGWNHFKMNFVTLLIFSAVLHWAVRRLFILSIGIFRLNGCKPQNNKTFTLPTPYQQHLWAIQIHFEFPIKAFASFSFRSKFIYWLPWSTISSLIYVKQFWKLQKLDCAKPAVKNKWSTSTNWSTLSFSTEHQLRDLKDLRGIHSNRSRVSPKEGSGVGLIPFSILSQLSSFPLQLLHPRPHNLCACTYTESEEHQEKIFYSLLDILHVLQPTGDSSMATWKCYRQHETLIRLETTIHLL